MKTRYYKIIESFKNKHILVVGDCMLDEWLWGKVRRISPEAPVPVVEVSYRTFTPGGAANVANNLSSLGATVTMAGVVGKDEAGRKLKDELKEKGIKTTGLIEDPGRPTTLKTRIIAHSQQVVRADHESNEKLSTEVQKKFIAHIHESMNHFDAIIFSDYNKGIISKDLIKSILEETKGKNIIVTAGPKPENIGYFHGIDIVALNELEAGLATGITIENGESLCSAGEAIIQDLACKGVLITRGEHGMSIFTKTGEIHHVPSIASEVYDVSGAGDTVISVLTLAHAAGASIFDSAILSNHAAAVVVKKVGTATLTPEELIASIKER